MSGKAECEFLLCLKMWLFTALNLSYNNIILINNYKKWVGLKVWVKIDNKIVNWVCIDNQIFWINHKLSLFFSN